MRDDYDQPEYTRGGAAGWYAAHHTQPEERPMAGDRHRDQRRAGEMADARAEIRELQRRMTEDRRYHCEAMAAAIADRDTYKEKLRAALALLQELRALKPPVRATR
jgi:hypothetical protein